MNLRNVFGHSVRWWGTFALLTVVFRTMQQMGSKDLVVHYQDPLATLVAIDALIVIFFTPLVVVDVARKLRAGQRLWHPDRGVVRNLLKWTVTEAIASLLFYEALRLGEFSVVGPLRQTGTIAAFVIGFFLANERDNWQQKLAGSLIVVVGGLLILDFEGKTAEVYPSVLAIGAAWVFALEGRFERYAIDPVNGAGMLPSVFAYACGVFITVGFATLLFAKTGSLESVVPIIGHTLTTPYLLLCIPIAGMVANWLNMIAFIGGQMVEVSAVLRLGVVATMIAGGLFFGEHITVHRGLGGAVLFLGVVIVAVPIRTLLRMVGIKTR